MGALLPGFQLGASYIECRPLRFDEAVEIVGVSTWFQYRFH